MSDFKTPLAKVRGLGSAKNGTHHWWVQRLTAIANIPLTIFVTVSFVGNLDLDHSGWTGWLSQPLVAVLMVLFVGNIFYHMRLGLQVAIEDYVHDTTVKNVSLIAITFVVIFMAALSIFSILQIAFGGY